MDFKKNKKGAGMLVGYVIFLVATVLVLSSVGVINIASITGGSSGDYIEAPYFATISCVDSEQLSRESFDLGANGEWIQGKFSSNTAQWDVILQSERRGFFSSAVRFEYYVCPQRAIADNCKRVVTSWTGDQQDLSIGQISSNEFLWVEYQKQTLFSYKASDGATIEYAYRPYILKRTDIFRGGTMPVYGAVGCQIPSTDDAWINRVLSFDGSLPDGTAKSRSLNVGEDFNYISGTVTRMSEGNVQDNGYCIYEGNSAKIYRIQELTFGSGRFNVVDTTKNPIKTVDCCEGSNLPDKTCVNGKWKSTVNAECSIVNPCEGTDWRRDLGQDKQVIKYSCVSGSCVAQTKEVECSQSSDCRTDEICSVSTWTCIDAGFGVGEGEERIPVNQEDCLKKGGEWIPKQEIQKDGLFGIGGKTVVVDAYCELDKPFNYTKWILIVAIVLFVLFFRNQIFAIFRTILRKIGIKI